MKHENLPSNHWLLGRVIEIHPDDEGTVRVVSLRTAKGVMKRAAARLCPLPIPVEKNMIKVVTEYLS